MPGLQCYPESGSLGSCLSELLMLEACELQSRQRLRLAEATLNVAAVTRGKRTAFNQLTLLTIQWQMSCS